MAQKASTVLISNMDKLEYLISWKQMLNEEENITINKNCIVPKKFLFAHYKSFIEENGYKPLGESQFSKKLQEELPFITASKNSVTIKHKHLSDRSRVYGGIFCSSTLYPEFEYKENQIQTNSINFDKDTKTLLI